MHTHKYEQKHHLPCFDDHLFNTESLCCCTANKINVDSTATSVSLWQQFHTLLFKTTAEKNPLCSPLMQECFRVHFCSSSPAHQPVSLVWNLISCLLYSVRRSPSAAILLKCCSHKSIVDILPDKQSDKASVGRYRMSVRKKKNNAGDKKKKKAKGKNKYMVLLDMIDSNHNKKVMLKFSSNTQKQKSVLLVCDEESEWNSRQHLFPHLHLLTINGQICPDSLENHCQWQKQLSQARQPCLLSCVVWLLGHYSSFGGFVLK